MTSGRGLALAVAALLLLVTPGSAQRAGRAGPPPAVRQRAVLIQEINRRLMNQARNQLALSPEQVPRFQRVVATYAQKRAALEAEEHRVRAALREQVKPGGAGNADSVSKLVDALNSNLARQTATFSDEMRDLGPILNPVQRGQWQVLRDRWLQQVRALQQQRPASDSSGHPEP